MLRLNRNISSSILKSLLLGAIIISFLVLVIGNSQAKEKTSNSMIITQSTLQPSNLQSKVSTCTNCNKSQIDIFLQLISPAIGALVGSCLSYFFLGKLYRQQIGYSQIALKAEFTGESDCIVNCEELHSVESELIGNILVVRLRITNISNSTAKECRGYLTGFERKENNKWINKFKVDSREIIYGDCLPLRWAFESIRGHNDITEVKNISLPSKSYSYIDVLVAYEPSLEHPNLLLRNLNQSNFSIPPQYPLSLKVKTLVQPHPYIGLIETGGEYKLSIRICAEKVKLENIELFIDWTDGAKYIFVTDDVRNTKKGKLSLPKSSGAACYINSQIKKGSDEYIKQYKRWLDL
jgi:hypothetical protein